LPFAYQRFFRPEVPGYFPVFQEDPGIGSGDLIIPNPKKSHEKVETKGGIESRTLAVGSGMIGNAMAQDL
jgi:hypothetical protein